MASIVRKAGAVATLVALALVAPLSKAALISVEPDDFANGTVLTNAYPGVTLSIVGSDSSSFVASRTSSGATTGTRVFGEGGSDQGWNQPFDTLRADFFSPVSRVLIDLAQFFVSPNAFLLAFDLSGTQIASSVGTAAVGGTAFEVNFGTNGIAYILAGAPDGQAVYIDNLRYEYASVPEPGTLALLGLGLAGLGLSRRRKAN